MYRVHKNRQRYTYRKKDMNKKGHIKEWICMSMALLYYINYHSTAGQWFKFCCRFNEEFWPASINDPVSFFGKLSIEKSVENWPAHGILIKKSVLNSTANKHLMMINKKYSLNYSYLFFRLICFNMSINSLSKNINRYHVKVSNYQINPLNILNF